MRSPTKATTVITIRTLSALAAVIVLFWALLRFDLRAQVLSLFQWLEQLGIWGPVLFILIYALVVVLVLPGFVFTIGAGFLFGALPGFAYVVISTTIGATIAFFLGRFLLGERARCYLRRRERLRLVTDRLIGEGWRMILLTRLTPLFPFKLSNYIMGLAHFRFKDFFIGTFFGVMPLSLVNAYIGAMAADLATLRTEAIRRSPVQWGVYAVGLLIMIVVIAYIARTAWLALNDTEPEETSAEEKTNRE